MLASVLILAAKHLPRFVDPLFWAEDGTVFFFQQHGHLLPRLFTAYSGYFHLLPRLAAWMALPFGTRLAPFIFAVEATLIEALAVTYTVYRMRRFIPEIIVLLALLILPRRNEIFGDITNMQWYTQFVVLAGALLPGRELQSRGARFAEYLLLVLSALSGPFSIFVTALAAAALIISKRPSRQTSGIFRGSIIAFVARIPRNRLAVVSGCALAQILALLVFPREIGERAPFTWEDHVALSGSLMIGIPIVALLGCGRRLSPYRRGLFIMLFLFGVIQPMASSLEAHVVGGFLYISRYSFALLTCVWLILGGIIATRSDQFPRAYVAALMALFLVLAAMRPGFEQAEFLDNLDWPFYAEKIDAERPIDVPLNPLDPRKPKPTWFMHFDGGSSARAPDP
jgi:hypothetical protein